MNLRNKNLLLAMAITSLAGCVSAASQYGSGPIQLASSVERRFEEYKGVFDPRFFAVSIDGNSYGYSRCFRGGTCRDFQQMIDIAVFSCQNRSNGVPCKIYARDKQVVWRSDGPAQATAVIGKSGQAQQKQGRRIKTISNQALCMSAIKGNEPAWDKRFPFHVTEAKSRGLTERQCARLSGRFG